jgi:hypothetical protein
MKRINNNNFNFNNLLKMIKTNKSTLLFFLLIIISFWLILYIIPNFFVSLFDTFLGNIILITTIILFFLKNYKYGILVSIIILIIYRFNKLSNISREGFTWSKESSNEFIKIQSTINPNIKFDINQIQKQATQEELDYFLKNGKWPWSEKTKELYTSAINSNPFVRTLAGDQINELQTIYNESAILQIISWQTKEGQFLLNGINISENTDTKDLPSGFGEFGYKSGLTERPKNIIRCDINTNIENLENQNNKLIQIDNYGNKIEIDYNNLEKLVPGFSFTKSPCNPCNALNSPPIYDCPFKLETTTTTISPVWEYLWSTNTTNTTNTTNSTNTIETNYTNYDYNQTHEKTQDQTQYQTQEQNQTEKEFPILSEIKSELNKLTI